MLDSIALQKVKGYSKASARLMGSLDVVGREERAVLFAAGGRLTPAQLRAVCHSAVEAEIDIVYLEFGPEIELGPRRVQIIVPQDGTGHLFADCAFWAPDGEGPMVLVLLNGHSSRFALTTYGIIQLAGRPAPSLTDGMNRAARRLREAAREFETEDWNDAVLIHS